MASDPAYKTPSVVKCAYGDLQTVKNIAENKWKWSAKCNSCGEKLTETLGTTSGFIKHLYRKHEDVHENYKKLKGKADSKEY